MATTPTPPDSIPPAAGTTADALKRAVRRGTSFVAVGQVTSQLISLAVLSALYRLVAPRGFGLFAMVLPLLMFLRIFSTLGLNVATVQRRELAQEELSSLFWLQCVLGCLTALVTIAAAPLLVWFFGRSELWSVTLTLAPTAVVAALGAQHMALLERDLRWGALVAVRLAAQAAAGAAAICMALAKTGVWALVLQQYVELAVIAALAWRLISWRPLNPRRGAPVWHLVRFGGYLTSSNALYQLSQYVDKLLVGYMLGPVALGLYSQAFNLMLKPVYVLTTPLGGIMLPALSRAAGDPEAYRALVGGFFRIVGILCLPAGIGLAIVAPDVMHVLGGPAWDGAGPLLRALAWAIAAQGFINIAGNVFVSRGQTGRLLLAAVAMTAVLFASYGVGFLAGRAFDQPALGVALGYSLALAGVVLVPYMAYCLHTAKLPASVPFAEIRTPLLATAGMAVLVILVRIALEHWTAWPIALQLALQIAVGVAAYAVLARRELAWLVSQARALRSEIATAPPA